MTSDNTHRHTINVASRGLDPLTSPIMATRKRRATDTGDAPSTSKKARASAHQDGPTLVKAILAKPDTYPILDDEDAVRRQFVELAQYARDLEEDLQSASPPPKTMTPDQLEAAVEKVRKAAHSGIKKQMGVCSFRTVFGFMVSDPLPSGSPLAKPALPSGSMMACALIRLSLEPFWGWTAHQSSRRTSYPSINSRTYLATSKLPLGLSLPSSCAPYLKLATDRYDNLYITGSHVNVRWSDSGEFKFSGTYGKYQPSKADR